MTHKQEVVMTEAIVFGGILGTLALAFGHALGVLGY